MNFPNIDPIAISLGPIVIRWYAIAYIAGLMLGWQYVRRLVTKPPHAMRQLDVDDLLVWATLGVVLGGRLGYVFFYKPAYYLQNPAEIFMLWQGGMAFHGGALGVIVAMYIFAKRRGLSFLSVGDAVVCAVPIGLFFGRIANFINGELFGRVAHDVPWAMVFPGGGPEPRHPSQLYQAGLEGIAIFLILFIASQSRDIRERRGTLGGIFLMSYGIARIIGELYRQPDAHLGYLIWGTTMGQWLSLPLVLVGLMLVIFAKRSRI